LLKDSWRQIAEDSKTLDAMRQSPYHEWILKLVYDDTAEQFTRIKDIPLADRLKALGIKREDYKAAVATLMTNLLARYNDIDKVEAPLGQPDNPVMPVPQTRYTVQPRPAQTKYGVEPRPQPKYGIRPEPEPEPPVAQPAYGVVPQPEPDIVVQLGPTHEFAQLREIFRARAVVAEAPEGVLIKHADSPDWVELKKGDVITVTDILAHEKDGDVKITFETADPVQLKGDFVLTSWEYGLPAKTLEGEISALITKLYDKDADLRADAVRRLETIGWRTLPQLRKGLDECYADILGVMRILQTARLQDPQKYQERLQLDYQAAALMNNLINTFEQNIRREIETLYPALNDPDPEVRANALARLKELLNTLLPSPAKSPNPSP
jgi:hypothetical protein